MAENSKPFFTRQSLALLSVALLAVPAAAAPPWFRGGGHGGGGGYRGGGYRAVGVYHAWGGYRPYGLHLGAYVPVLPRTSLAITFGGGSWWYDAGVWYRPYGRRYIAAFPPLGICVPFLPPGPRLFWAGGLCYYSVNDIYYTQEADGGYRVVAPPPGQEPYPDYDSQEPARPEPPRNSAVRPDPGLEALTISPNKGQTPDQMRADRQAARRYATDKTGYDPARSDPSDPGTPRARRAYLQTFRAFLEGRGYTVD